MESEGGKENRDIEKNGWPPQRERQLGERVIIGPNALGCRPMCQQWSDSAHGVDMAASGQSRAARNRGLLSTLITLVESEYRLGSIKCLVIKQVFCSEFHYTKNTTPSHS